MNKIKLLCTDTELPTFDQPWFRPIVNESFNLIYDQHNVPHSPRDTIIVTKLFGDREWFQKYKDQGYKIIIDNFWEPWQPPHTEGAFVLYNKNCMWYNESLWYSYRGFDSYIPNKNFSKSFLMLMARERPHRNRIINAVRDLLSDSIYSYVDKGICLESDIDHVHEGWERHFDPAWYDSTAFSMVVESFVLRDDPGPHVRDYADLSEKTWKAISYYHPFIVLGDYGILEHLRTEQFETFDHIIDESYDAIENYEIRYTAVLKVLRELHNRWSKDRSLFDDTVTIEKTKYNHNRFFNKQLVIDRIKEEMFNPIIEFANL